MQQGRPRAPPTQRPRAASTCGRSSKPLAVPHVDDQVGAGEGLAVADDEMVEILVRRAMGLGARGGSPCDRSSNRCRGVKVWASTRSAPGTPTRPVRPRELGIQSPDDVEDRRAVRLLVSPPSSVRQTRTLCLLRKSGGPQSTGNRRRLRARAGLPKQAFVRGGLIWPPWPFDARKKSWVRREPIGGPVQKCHTHSLTPAEAAGAGRPSTSSLLAPPRPRSPSPPGRRGVGCGCRTGGSQEAEHGP